MITLDVNSEIRVHALRGNRLFDLLKAVVYLEFILKKTCFFFKLALCSMIPSNKFLVIITLTYLADIFTT